MKQGEVFLSNNIVKYINLDILKCKRTVNGDTKVYQSYNLTNGNNITIFLSLFVTICNKKHSKHRHIFEFQ